MRVPSWSDIIHGVRNNINTNLNALIAKYVPSFSKDIHVHKRVRPDTSSLPLHAKDVFGSVVLAQLHALSSVSASVVAELKHQLGWLYDDSRYRDVPLRSAAELPRAKLSAAQVQTMHRKGLIRVIDRAHVRGAVNMFVVAELSKNRVRPIRHTADANDVFPRKDPLHPVTMATKPVIVSLVHGGTHMASHDLAGWFDQLSYSDDVGSRFCFEFEGVTYALTCLAMGQRQSVGVASAVTRRLLDLKHRSARCEIVIDNIIFVGSKEDVIADSKEFRRRCAEAGAILNDLEIPVEELAVQRGDWCGISLDFVNKTVALQDKAIGKTLLAWSLRDQWTWRQFHACVGSLFLSIGIIEVPVYTKFCLLRFISRVSADLAVREDLWDAHANIWPSALADMQSWVELIQRNQPRVVPKDDPPEWILHTDASRYGWGYVAICVATNSFRSHGQPWSQHMLDKYGEQLGHSTFAEPHAVRSALCHLFAPNGGIQRIMVCTDNSATFYSFDRGYSSQCLHINQCIGRLRECFPGVVIDMRFVPGVLNWADAPSRGRSLSPEEEIKAAEALLREMGERRLPQ